MKNPTYSLLSKRAATLLIPIWVMILFVAAMLVRAPFAQAYTTSPTTENAVCWGYIKAGEETYDPEERCFVTRENMMDSLDRLGYWRLAEAANIDGVGNSPGYVLAVVNSHQHACDNFTNLGWSHMPDGWGNTVDWWHADSNYAPNSTCGWTNLYKYTGYGEPHITHHYGEGYDLALLAWPADWRNKVSSVIFGGSN